MALLIKLGLGLKFKHNGNKFIGHSSIPHFLSGLECRALSTKGFKHQSSSPLVPLNCRNVLLLDAMVVCYDAIVRSDCMKDKETQSLFILFVYVRQGRSPLPLPGAPVAGGGGDHKRALDSEFGQLAMTLWWCYAK